MLLLSRSFFYLQNFSSFCKKILICGLSLCTGLDFRALMRSSPDYVQVSLFSMLSFDFLEKSESFKTAGSIE